MTNDFLNDHIRQRAGPEPTFDPVITDFLCNCRDEINQRCQAPGLLEAHDLGISVPWLWRLDFRTRGLVKNQEGTLASNDHHLVVVRFLPDYLRRVNRFEVLHLLAPVNAFHPNLREGHICLEVYPGEPLIEICEALHALFSWRLRQLNEMDALNRDACVWGRAHLDELPLDSRPLFGRELAITLDPLEEGE
jgi:hypothetical protein